MSKLANAIDTALCMREAFGQPVFPVIDKVPQIAGWNVHPLVAEKSIVKVFEATSKRKPGRRIDVGIPTGRHFGEVGYSLVLDSDKRAEGEEALAKLPELPLTSEADTANDGKHRIFRTVRRITSFVRPDGLEIKGLGSFIVVPTLPATDGRCWRRLPFPHVIEDAPAWLLEKPEQPRAKREIVLVERNLVTGESCRLYEPVVCPIPGNRNNDLRRIATYWGFQGRSSDQHYLQLFGAGLKVGLTEQQCRKQIKQGFEYAARHSCNSSFNAAAAASAIQAGRSRRAYTGIVRFSETDKRVLKTVLEIIKEQPVGDWTDLDDAWAQALSCRYVAGEAGLKSRDTARLSLNKLCIAGYLWLKVSDEGMPVLIKINGKLTRQYRPTWAGVAYAEQELGVNPVRPRP